jgi:ubiquinone/menaquinone biosynthesis C-methylase UbiE
MEPKLDDIRERSRRVWDTMAAGWETRREDLWQISRTVSEWLVERVDPRPGQAILDLAAGVGDTGLLAARRLAGTGRVLVTDFAPRMVAAARRRAAELGITNAEFRELDGERMALESASVDGVVCRWGYMLMPDPGAAFAETYRVLRPGGRLAFAVFGPPDRNPWASVVGRILVEERHMAPPAPGTPGIFALSDTTRLRELVSRAGFASPEVAEMGVTWRFPTVADYWSFLTEMAGAISPILQGLSPEARARVQARTDEMAEPFRSGDGYAFSGLCVNVSTHRPSAPAV